MGINEKFRTLAGAQKSTETQAERATNVAAAVVAHHNALALALGYEAVREPAGEGKVSIRYRRRLPKWLAWVRR